jgi:hypothetical protein
MIMAGAVVAVSGVSIASLSMAVVGCVLALLPRGRLPAKTEEAASLPEAIKAEEIQPSSSNFRLYRQAELNRIKASLLANSSILVAGEEGSGKSV